MLLEPMWNHCVAQVWDIAAFTEQVQVHDGSNAKQAVSLRAIGAVAAHDKVCEMQRQAMHLGVHVESGRSTRGAEI